VTPPAHTPEERVRGPSGGADGPSAGRGTRGGTTLWHPCAPLSAVRSSVGSAVGLRTKRVLRPLDGFEVLEDEEDPEALGRPA
jgi:hypothetical protein